VVKAPTFSDPLLVATVAIQASFEAQWAESLACLDLFVEISIELLMRLKDGSPAFVANAAGG
jgi:hypothetical protein